MLVFVNKLYNADLPFLRKTFIYLFILPQKMMKAENIHNFLLLFVSNFFARFAEISYLTHVKNLVKVRFAK